MDGDGDKPLQKSAEGHPHRQDTIPLPIQFAPPNSGESHETTLYFCSACWVFAKKRDSYNRRFDVSLSKLKSSSPSCRTCEFLTSVIEQCIRPHEQHDGALSVSIDSDGDCNGFSGQRPPFELEWHYELAMGVREHITFELDLVPERDKPPEQMYVGRSERSIRTALSWLQSCTSRDLSHRLCDKENHSFFPTRLLDLGDLNPNSSIRLREKWAYATEHPEGDFRYAALSYCWGPLGSPKLETTTSTLQTHKYLIPRPSLPRAFQDAVIFVRLLGVRFLWIDSLCIIQDDVGDWERESAQMADIYSNSYFTLSAATTPHPGVGLFREISSEMRALPSMVVGRSCSQRQPTIMYARRLDYFNVGTDVRDYPLMKRGWVFQEYLLSPRLIFFHESGLGWVCNSCTLDEAESQNFLDLADMKLRRAATLRHALSGTGSGRPPEFSSEDWKELIAQEWRRNVSQYCSLKLTFETDRLPAIGGIAAQMAQMRQGPYLGGLWCDSLLKDLTWHTWSEKPWSPFSTQPRPTWTWASVGEPVAFQCDPRGDMEWFVSEVVDAHCELKGSNPFGQVTGGFIRLSGPLLRAKPVFDDQGSMGLRISRGSSESQLLIRLDYFLPETEATGNLDLFCLPLICQTRHVVNEWGENDVEQTIFLVLVPHTNPNPCAFERIGLAYTNELINDVDEENLKTITII